MPEERETALIAIFFSIIVGAGLNSFVTESVFFANLSNGNLLQPLNFFPSIIGLAFFISAFVFVLFHWLTYQKIIEIHPYQERPMRFFIDIMIFSTMFLIMVISPTIYKDSSIGTFIVLILFMCGFQSLSFFWWSKLTREVKTRYNEKTSTKSEIPNVFDPIPDKNIHKKMIVVFVPLILISIGVTISPPEEPLRQYIILALIFSAAVSILIYSVQRYLRFRAFDEKKLIRFEEWDDRTWEADGSPKYYSHYKYRERENCIFYHIRLWNDHQQKSMHNCMVYLIDHKPLGVVVNGHEQKKLDPVEFKWKGVHTKDVIIAPLGFRDFDAFYVVNDDKNDGLRNPKVIHLGYNAHLTDFTKYPEEFALLEDHYRLKFVVYSLNFPSKEQEIMVHNDGNIYNKDDKTNSQLPNNSKYHLWENRGRCNICIKNNFNSL
jgi:hypothetical protein